MSISFGVAGIPLTCKGRTLKDSIDDIHALELDAMEVQLLRFPIFEKDNIYKLGILSKELEVTMSVHSPYYMDLFGNSSSAERSIENIKSSLEVANDLKACKVVSHMGLYNGMSPSKAMKKAIDTAQGLVAYMEEREFSCELGFETSGRRSVFGSLDEILTLTEEVPEISPVINFGHIHAREEGILRKKKAYQRIFDQVRSVTGKKIFYTAFSGVAHKNGDKIMDTPIKKSDIKFEPLAKCILDNEDYDVTIISSSPLLEHDAQYMKLMLDRLKARRERKETRKKSEGEEGEGEEGEGEEGEGEEGEGEEDEGEEGEGEEGSGGGS